MSASPAAADVEPWAAYRTAFTDWLACATAGADRRAARAMRLTAEGLLADVAFAGTAGHVLDYDDTFPEGVAHVSAATAPAALMVSAHLGLSLQAALEAYADGFEAMAQVAAAGHPALYDAGWHPTAVCGPVGAAVAACRLLDLPARQRQNAIAIALLRAGGTRGAFGSDGKAIQVGLAAAAGVQGALAARAGAEVDPRAVDGPFGFTGVVGAGWPWRSGGWPGCGDRPPAITRTWIKLHPSCLGTHSPIDAALELRDGGAWPELAERLEVAERLGGGERLAGGERLEVAVHPVARQAAHLDAVGDGLSAKFSIPYCVAHTLMHGPPRLRDFDALDAAVAERSRQVAVVVDESQPEFGAAIRHGGRELARVPCPRGAPQRPISERELHAKLAELAGERLDGLFDRPDVAAATAARASGLGPSAGH